MKYIDDELNNFLNFSIFKAFLNKITILLFLLYIEAVETDRNVTKSSL